MPTHDITIPFANSPRYNRYAVALEIQDACNLSGVSRELVKAITKVREEEGDPTNDPAVILIVNKIYSLVRWSGDRFGEAYDACQAKKG